MASNLTRQGIGMENFNVFDTGNPNLLISKTRQKVPEEINSYAPGSPKPARDFDLQRDVSDFDTKKGQAGSSGNVNEQLKDAQIKQLTREQTILHAQLRQYEERYSFVVRARDQTVDELRKMNEHCLRLSNERASLHDSNKRLTEEIIRFKSLVNQCHEKSESSPQLGNDNEVLCNEIQRLKVENSNLKKTSDSLASECSALRASLITTGSNESSSMMSNESYSKELESLHSMVDALKSTVLKQRNVLLKLKGPNLQTKETSDSKKAKKNESDGLTNSSGAPLRSRQGEESTGPLVSEVRGETDSRRHLELVGDTHFDVSQGIPNALGIMSNNYEDLLTQPPEYEAAMSCRILPDASGNVSAHATEGENTLGSSHYGAASNNELLYMNANDTCHQTPLNPSPLNFDINHKDSSAKDSSVAGQDLRQQTQTHPHLPVRKTSSEVIGRLPQHVPPKSKSEILGCNPKMKSQPDFNRQPSPPGPTILNSRHQNAPQRQRQELAYTAAPTTKASSDMNQLASHRAVESSHMYAHAPLNRFETNSHITCDADGWAKADTLELSPPDVMNAAPIRCATYSPTRHPNTDRLCPVCNKDFGNVSIEQFQSHVLDCFDSDNGPETMVAEDSEPPRVCPMCNMSFRDNMPQSEFEKHVHSHFDDDSGENFELLNP